jgi:hypothetical protein
MKLFLDESNIIESKWYFLVGTHFVLGAETVRIEIEFPTATGDPKATIGDPE